MIIVINDTYYQLDKRTDLIKQGQYCIYRRFSTKYGANNKILSRTEIYEKTKVVDRGSFLVNQIFTSEIPHTTLHLIKNLPSYHFRITGQWKIKSVR